MVTGPEATAPVRYLVALGLVALFAVIAKNLVRGRVGRSWMAIRDRDIAAEIIGVRPLRTLLDRQVFLLSDSDLEILFRPIAAAAGLPQPHTKTWVNGYEVDFFWPELGLVVETDGLRYHRTASQQTRDRRRDQTHVATGLTQLRFTHWQVKHEPAYVRKILHQTIPQLSSA